MSPTQAEVLDHLDRADCPLLWWQATHGIKRARFDSVRALFGEGLIMRHPCYSGPNDDLAWSYFIPSAKGSAALKKWRSGRSVDQALQQIEGVGRLIDRVVGRGER